METNNNSLLEYNENNELVINADILARLNELRALKKATDDEYKKLTDALTKEIRKTTNDSATRISDYNLIKKGGNWTYELDLDKLMKEFADVYDKCLKPVQEKVSFSLTYAIRERKAKENV